MRYCGWWQRNVCKTIPRRYGGRTVGPAVPILTSDRTLAQLAETLGWATTCSLSEAACKDTLANGSPRRCLFEAVLAALYLETHNFSLIRPLVGPPSAA